MPHSDLTLYIGNKNYSSWSLRAYIALEHTGLPYKEVLIPLKTPASKAEISKISPSGTVPCLHHEGSVVWDSLAIAEYVHELEPAAGLLPEDRRLRALTRSVVAEMHASFTSLRGECPMDMKKEETKAVSDTTLYDLKRIYTIWDMCKAERRKGPFLLGDFTMADAFFAPVVSRIRSYGLPVEQHADYIETITHYAPYQRWLQAAKEEK